MDKKKKVIKLKKVDKKVKIVNRDGYYKLLKFIYFLIYTFLLILFLINVNNYSKTNVYEDEEVVIKEMPLWYNVYKKNWELKEINFFNWKISDKDLKIFVKNQLLFEDKKDKKENIVLKEPTNFKEKTKKDIIKDIIIKKIVKIDRVHYITLFVEETKEKNNKEKKYNYCFKEDSLDFSSKEWTYCFFKSKEDLNFSFTRFKKLYVFWLKDKIYFYNPLTKKFELIIKTKNNVISIDRNKQNDLKVILQWKEIKISHIYIQYYLIKRINLKKETLYLNIDDLM